MDERVLARIPEGHPRVLLNERRIAELRQAIQGTHRWIWERLRVRIDEMAERRVPDITSETPWSTRRRPDMAAPPDVRYPNIALTVPWMMKYGYPIPFTALGYLLTGEARYLKAAKRWMRPTRRPPPPASSFNEETNSGRLKRIAGINPTASVVARASTSV